MIGLAVGLFLSFACLAQSIRVTKIEVPRYLVTGVTTTLRCHFNLDDEKLYSLTWWKDDRQFYQYIPKNDPKIVVFKVPGVQVNALKSNLHSVELNTITKSSAGEYRCEVVGEAPTFNTQIRGANLSIIDPPDGPPVVRGLKQIYHPGEVIRLNCTSYRSWPAPKIMWEVLSVEKAATLLTSSSSSSHTLPQKMSYYSPSSLISSSSFSSSSTKRDKSANSSPISSSIRSSLIDSSTSTFSSLISSSSSLSSPFSSSSLTPYSSSKVSNVSKRSYSNNSQHYKLAALLWRRRYPSITTHSMFANYVLRSYRKTRGSWNPRRKGRNPSSRRANKRSERNAELPLAVNAKTLLAPSNYTEVVEDYLIHYELQRSEDTKPTVYSATIGIQFPASLTQAPSDGQFTLRCRSSIHPYHWATEVRINIAAVPVADPQQLPTLHGTGAPRDAAACPTGINMTFYLLVLLLISLFTCSQ